MTRQELIDWVEAEIAAFPCKTSLLMMDLQRGVELLNHDGDAQVTSASTIKVPILMTALDLASQNKLSMDQMVPIGTPFEDTTVFEPENLQSEYTLMELLEWMIINSDNTATNAVIDLLGMDAVNAFVTRVGAKQTVLQRKMLDFEAQKAGRDNLTSARDQFMFYALMSWCAKRDALWQEGMEMLYRQRGGAFMRYLCGPLSLAHKPGGLDHVAHDAGLFMNNENPFYLGIFTWDGPSMDGQPEQQRFIARLAKKIYHWRMGMI